MTEDVLNKLENAFSYGLTDKQACFEAGISHQALYDYQNNHPEFTERKEALKDNPKVLAKKIVVDALKDGDKHQANWYLERKVKDEFSTKQEIDKTTEHKGNINFSALSDDELRELM